jgi:guanylate kinase
LAAGPLLVVLTGPSGVGKDSLLAHLKSLERPYYFATTATTRAPRKGEVPGTDPFLQFLSEQEFDSMLRRGGLLEHAIVYGNRYGVPKAPISEALSSGRDVLLRTDIQGARTIKVAAPGAVTIFVAAPSQAELERRLRARGADTARQMALRLRIAREEMAAAGEFDYTIVNDDLARCATEIETIMSRERSRPERAAVQV